MDADAKIIGLVDVIGPPDELEDFTLERLSQIASHPGEAFAAIKDKLDGLFALQSRAAVTVARSVLGDAEGRMHLRTVLEKDKDWLVKALAKEGFDLFFNLPISVAWGLRERPLRWAAGIVIVVEKVPSTTRAKPAWDDDTAGDDAGARLPCGSAGSLRERR